MKKESPENIHQQDVNLREAVARRARKYPQRPQGFCLGHLGDRGDE